MFQKLSNLLVNSISAKITLSVILSYLIVASLSVLLLTNLKSDLIQQRIKVDLPQKNQITKSYLDEYFSHLEDVAHLANSMVRQNAFHQHLPATILKPLADGSYRQQSTNSAAFLAKRADFDHHLASVFAHTEVIFEQLAPLMKKKFFNFYVITEDDFIRISPGDWANQIEANHSFSGDVFYRIAMPEFNPEKRGMWTPVYFDDIWQQWMISYIVPIYSEGAFKGVTGSDVFISDLAHVLDSDSISIDSSQIFLFDEERNLIFHPEYNDILVNSVEAMNTILDSRDMLSPALSNVVTTFQTNKNSQLVQRFQQNNKQYWMSALPLDGLPWHVALFESDLKLEAYIEDFKYKVILSCLLMGALLSALLYMLINKTILSRLSLLAYEVENHKNGLFNVSRLTKNNDEVAIVALALKNMTEENETLLVGLKQEIAEKSLAEIAANRFSDAIKYSDIAIAILDEQFAIDYVNPKLCDLVKLTEKQLYGERINIIFDQLMHWQLEDAYEALKKGESWKGEILLKSASDKAIWLSQNFSPLHEKHTGKLFYLASSHDVTSIKNNQQAMEKLAYYDTLTGLCNRAFFKTQLAKAFEMSKRGHHQFALLYFDLDQFKRINDNLGHEAGDNLLITISERLKNRLRTEDSISRLGGDEFAIIVNGIADVEKIANLAQSILGIIQEPIQLKNAEVLASASIGITLAPNDAENIEILLRNADLAMYKAKEAGRNTYYFFDPKLDLAAKEHTETERELRDALYNEQFVLYYQPQIDLNSGTIFGFEALIRWLHPRKGVVSPDNFIPIAEQTGLIVPIGDWVLKEACHFIKRINSQFNQKFTVAVNLSARQFKDKSLVKTIKMAIEMSGIKASELDLEVTETMLVGDVNQSIKHMKEIKKLGVKLSIDDFGTGYSSLSYLKQFPLDTLKIDRAFVKDIPQDADDMAITSAIIAMAQKLNLEVIAEGVETLEQIDFLVDNACQIGQGYWFSQPIPEALIFEYVAEYQHNNIIANSHID